jgi:SOS-response transcriptional repressor LexA
MHASVETARDSVREALAFLRGLAAHPEDLVAIRLRDANDIVIFERGASAREDELVAVRLTLGRERRTALGRLRHEHGCARWQPSHPRWAARGVRPDAVQVLGRVLSVIHLGQNGQPETAGTAI